MTGKDGRIYTTAENFRLEIVTPEGCPLIERVVFLDVPAAYGRLTILAHHEPLVALLKPGLVRIKRECAVGEALEEEKWRIGPGVLTVETERVTLIVRRAERLN